MAIGQNAQIKTMPTASAPGIDLARFMAVILLVGYHVVGSGPDAGLKVPADDPVSLLNAFFADVRMPLFAAIAGFVYALKPVKPQNLGRFLTGKLRRLVVPGAVAIALFLIMSQIMNSSLALGHDWPKAFVMPYAHYWFLQAILVIFIGYGSFDILTKGRWLIPSLIIAVGWYLSSGRVPFDVMSVNRAFYLLPYFIFGVVMSRNAAVILRKRGAFLTTAGLAFVFATALNVQVLMNTGHFSESYRDVQSLLAGSAFAAICLFALPRIGWLRGFGALSFTIYLYHIFGTSFARRGLEYLGIGDQNLLVHIPVGILAGLAVPYVIHKIAEDHRIGQSIILGQRLRMSTT